MLETQLLFIQEMISILSAKQAKRILDALREPEKRTSIAPKTALEINANHTIQGMIKQSSIRHA